MTLHSLALVLLAALTLTACKDGLVEPERFGSIQGVVIDFETGSRIPNAAVTTTPATDAITADGDGAFTVTDVLTGTYTLTASRTGYLTSTATVAVREGRTAQAAIYLKRDAGTPGTPGISAEVLRFTNEPFTADSSFVTVEYRARNRSDVSIGSYEVYFRIDTDKGPFYQEIAGTDLAAGEQDLSQFRKQIFGGMASTVSVDTTSTAAAAAAEDARRALRRG